jgi:glycosyltransferase involved in cell wall biosynthesis
LEITLSEDSPVIIYQAPWNWDALWNRAQPLAKALTHYAQVIYLDLNAGENGKFRRLARHSSGLERIQSGLYRFRWAAEEKDWEVGVVRDRSQASYDHLASALKAALSRHPEVWLLSSRPACKKLHQSFEFHKQVIDIEDPWLSLPWGSTVLSQGCIHHIFSKANLVSANGLGIARTFQGMAGSQIFILPNGIDIELLDEIRASRETRARNRRAIAAYTGNINDRFNLEQLGQVVSECPDVDFLFVGKDNIAPADAAQWASIKKMKNFTVKSAVPHTKLAQILVSADALLLPYDTKKCSAMFPAKLYEYLATGAPVLASIDYSEYVPGLRSLKLCKEAASLVETLRFISTERPRANREDLDEIDLLLNQNTWSSRAKQLFLKASNLKS